MQITMSDKVFDWYKNELDLTYGDNVRFFVRYGGLDCHIKGFSLGMKVEDIDRECCAVYERDGISFYVCECDKWYFEGKNLHIDFDEMGEPKFHIVN